MTREQARPYISFCVDDDGRVIGYYGVPSGADYFRKAVKANGVYGLLHYFYALRHRRRCLAVDARAGPEGCLDAVGQIRMDHRLWHGRGRDAQRCCVEPTSSRLTRAVAR